VLGRSRYDPRACAPTSAGNKVDQAPTGAHRSVAGERCRGRDKLPARVPHVHPVDAAGLAHVAGRAHGDAEARAAGNVFCGRHRGAGGRRRVARAALEHPRAVGAAGLKHATRLAAVVAAIERADAGRALGGGRARAHRRRRVAGAGDGNPAAGGGFAPEGLGVHARAGGVGRAVVAEVGDDGRVAGRAHRRGCTRTARVEPGDDLTATPRGGGHGPRGEGHHHRRTKATRLFHARGTLQPPCRGAHRARGP
jgi:hypothetical protein